MDLRGSSNRHGILERMLIDEKAEPTDLPLSLLENITNCFSPDHEIGSGGSAVVYMGKVGNGMVAVKKLTRTIDVVHENKFHKEVECLIKAKHKNIVRFLGYCSEAHGRVEDFEGKFVMADRRNWLLCFEHVPNGSLEKYITDASSGLEWKERFQIIRGICEGLNYLHMNRILHLDLKPANILLDGHMVPKIADFGISRSLEEEKTHGTTKHLSGTPGYLAPEFYRGMFTFASDIYSLGVIIMEMLTGLKGYPEDENVTNIWMNRLEWDTELEQVKACTKIGIECMESDPKKRPVAQHIIDMLDKTTNAYETGSSSSFVELHVSLLKNQSDRERIGNLAKSHIHEDINECHTTKDAVEHLGNDHSHQGEENAVYQPLWEEEDTEQKVNLKETSIMLSVLSKLNILNIFRRDGIHPFSKNRKDSHRNFLRNGGRVLRNVKGLRIFTKGEIKKITRNFSKRIAEGSFAAVYEGTLPDNTMVSVKRFAGVHLDRQEAFVKGVLIHTKMIHKNILNLIGYCLEEDVPISVHEYIANGSLLDILHYPGNQMLPLELRLDIAIGCAEGLRHMHIGKIRHGDIRPENIFLDENLTPKISDFGLSRLLNVDRAVTMTVGSIGYIDPMYLRTGVLTHKSDVYGFGAVLMELITRKKNSFRGNYNLIFKYREWYEINKSGREMFDKEIAAEEDISILEKIGKLALECLNEDIEERPEIMEVTDRLVLLRKDR